ncbi:MAG TPA: hypothetical protein VFC44_12345 [Candidatus Saccharimonadales bacterium]|nr:hypothetical protein [Candidatus Saccharimonadales bacterium]
MELLAYRAILITGGFFFEACHSLSAVSVVLVSSVALFNFTQIGNHILSRDMRRIGSSSVSQDCYFASLFCGDVNGLRTQLSAFSLIHHERKRHKLEATAAKKGIGRLAYSSVCHFCLCVDSSGIDFDFRGHRFASCLPHYLAVVATGFTSTLRLRHLLALAFVTEPED